MLQFPDFDPVALRLGPLAIHWYGLTYLAAFALFLVFVDVALLLLLAACCFALLLPLDLARTRFGAQPDYIII
jgi:prolipoprotein diacylglyceryltransferase